MDPQAGTVDGSRVQNRLYLKSYPAENRKTSAFFLFS